MEKEFNQENVRLMELSLSKFFTDKQNKERVPSQDIIKAIKLPGFRKSEIRKAKKRLGIKTQNIDGIYYWKWGNQEDPEKVWNELSKKIWEEIPK